ncbi:Transposable element Tcb2 transposase [Holothuria leucospilota]|uniref:Transposable element Tcb2 transposase n=1 Tax=Holothuria leucospilota TaxID=206669 RepID=A0A9Q1CRP9_HOLLE|nr:Transposable element Tcb2 transposase [Holothuria leucospilota]
MSGQSRLFLQDGDPSENSERVRNALMNVTIFNIPPRSPDLNPIENVFKLLADTLRRDALENNIEVETFRAFRRRVISTLMAMPREIIDNIISSMPKRIDSIIQSKGGRLKY